MNLRDYYKESILPELSPLRSSYDSIKEKAKEKTLLIISLTGVLVVFFILGHAPSFAYYVLIAISLFAISRSSGLLRLSEIRHKTFQIVSDAVAKYHHSSLNCRPDFYIEEDSFKRSSLFTSPDSYTGSMLVDGEVDGIPLSFSYIYAQERDDSDEDRTNYITIFRGLFMRFVLPWQINSKIMIWPSATPTGLGRIFRPHRKWQLITLENPTFSKNFTVLATDLVDPYMIITPEFMERYLKLMWSLRENIYLSIIPERVYVAVSGINPPGIKGMYEYPFKYEIAEDVSNYITLGLNIFRTITGNITKTLQKNNHRNNSITR